MSTGDFYLISTLRRDPTLLSSESPYYLLPLHRDRLLAAAKAFQWPEAVKAIDSNDTDLQTDLEQHVTCEHALEERKGPLRIRIQISRSGELSFVSVATPPLVPPCLSPSSLERDPWPEEQQWSFYVCPHRVRPDLFTQHKTSHRVKYEALWPWPEILALDKRKPPARTEILLQNHDHEIMEGTISTVYFWRDRGSRWSWVTPAASCGGNIGVTRRWALETGAAVEGNVKAETVQAGEVVWVSNGVRGFMQGKVKQWEELVQLLEFGS